MKKCDNCPVYPGCVDDVMCAQETKSIDDAAKRIAAWVDAQVLKEYTEYVSATSSK